MSAKRHLITAALPYANGPLHIGHLAGAYLTADIYARYLRLQGKDVVFVCGSDEHGAAIQMRAIKEGLSPKAIVDKYHAIIVETFARLGVSFDVYHRTSDPLHHATAQAFFTDLAAKGEFLVEESAQYFDEAHQQFLADRYIIGTCPNCGNPDAYGDQCEKCGSTLSPTELLPPLRSMLSDAPPVMRPTKHWYFDLAKHTDWLRTWVKTGEIDGQLQHDPAAWKNHVLGQCGAWLGNNDEDKLLPRAITRDLEWGVPVPLEAAKGKVLYVWFDAPIGYISATKQWAINQGKPEAWRDYWQNEDTELVHFIGKDNIVFHCIIFPAMLRAHGKYVLPTNVPANQFMNLEGDKISTSRNWAVWAHEYLDDFATLPNAADVLRYVMIRNMPEQKDSEFTWAGFKENNDSELVNTFANSINRVVTLINKYYAGEVPPFSHTIDADLLCANTRTCVNNIAQHIEAYSFREALAEMLNISRLIDGTLQTYEPWKLYKNDPDSALIKDVLYVCLQSVAVLSVVSQPFLPHIAQKLREILQLENLKNGDWASLELHLANNTPLIPAGHHINPPEHLFARMNDDLITAQLEKLHQSKAATVMPVVENVPPAYQPEKPTIVYDDFGKMDLRIGTIMAAQKIKKADKLLQLTVDLGYEQRTVVSGIALHYTPEEIIGQQVVLLANLAPRTMRGIESNGMILMAENAAGKLVFVSPQTVGFENGSTVQ